MNPIFKDKNSLRTYCIIMVVFGALYALLFGLYERLGWEAVAVDAVLYTVLYGAVGIALWIVLRYAVPAGGNAFIRLPMLSLAGLAVVICVTGIECLVMYAIIGEGFALYTRSVPLRAFISVIAYLAFVFYYRDSLRPVAETSAALVANPGAIKEQPREMERITVRNGQKITVITLDEIQYIQADGDYVLIVTTEGRWLKEHTMKHFEEQLPADRFARIHRSYIVGLDKIVRIERYGNLHQVSLAGGEKIKVSATGYKNLKDKLNL